MNISTNVSKMNSIQHAQYLRQLATESMPTLNINPSPTHSKANIKSHPKKLALALAGMVAFSPMANAALPPDIDVFNNIQEVSDGDLGHMRGKFASNNQVMYFGIEMVSQWQTPSGNLVTAGANLNIDFQVNGSTPTVQYVPTVTIVSQGQDAASAQNGSTNSVSGGAGLANVSGVSQSIQVAGQSNSINNGIDMQVNISSSAQAGGLVSSALQGHAGSVSANADDGTVATVTLSHNSIGVSVVVPGQGQVLQQIRNQGMFQSARIGGDLNQIHNNITMHIGLNSASGAGSAGAFAALQGLKTLSQNGMF
ncbi:MAG: hypothetical protein Q8S46_01105 [Methylotenera sp.]|nr:hypothetical protein [Methylotenera sp.]MDP1755105.1 hypothetical protein [Methylotenera sp.]MDP1958313.1 hypothetical protein [Methylotenera sp.]MDP3206962.1 hypothetical protein [Methylotenera sp.]MDP3302738.1 hypothetical protein [Methylotenera sp.]